MGDYYKFKKILIILMIISCGFSIIKNIFKTHVEASEAVEVTPNWQDGNYTVQADNNYLSIQQSALNIQENVIDFFYFWKSNGSSEYVSYLTARLQVLFNVMSARYNRSSPIYVTFYRPFDGDYNDVTFAYTIFGQGAINNGQIVFRDATLSDGYKLINQPFYTFNLSQYSYTEYIRNDNITTRHLITSGSTYVACAEVGVYSRNWIDLFKYYGIIENNTDYNNILASIEETNELAYTQSYYTRELVENTYNSINNSNVTTISSSGITQPNVNEPDLSDAFDSITDLLTNDNATTKTFTFTLPNNDSFNFSLDPNFLRTSLTRVGGSSLVTIIETLWYIGLYGLFIFTYLKILGALLAGDLDNVTGVLSPVNSVVSSSLEVTGAFKTSGGDESAFRFRKG